MTNTLRKLYDASAEDMIYGIGTMEMGTGPPVPIISIQYRDWSREMLEVVRESFKSGIVLTCTERRPGVHQVYLATREQIKIEHGKAGHTSVLGAAAWDAHLANVDDAAFQVFDARRRQRGGYLLLVQARGWEFLTMVDDGRGAVIVGVLLACVTATCDKRARPINR